MRYFALQRKDMLTSDLYKQLNTVDGIEIELTRYGYIIINFISEKHEAVLKKVKSFCDVFCDVTKESEPELVV